MAENKRMVFSTKRVAEIKQMIEDGYIPQRIENPFYDGKIGLRKEKVTFRVTDEEYEEYLRCKLDVKYFANNYCRVKSEDGTYKIIELRDYQHEILDMFQNPSNKFNILMASRQVGKCLSFTTRVTCRYQYKGEEIQKDIPLYKLFFQLKDNKTIYDYLKYPLYWLLSKLETYQQ